MRNRLPAILLCSLLLVTLSHALAAAEQPGPDAQKVEPEQPEQSELTEQIEQAKPLIDYQRIFAKRIEKVGDNVYSAIGYGLANSIMIVVQGGKVIIDTTESVTAAREIKREFDRIAPGPVKAIIYTHSHADHILGASVFHEEGVEIWAHERAVGMMNEQFASLASTVRRRAAKMFGENLEPSVKFSNGIGITLRLDPGPTPPILYPTKTFTDTATLEIGGVKFELYEGQGETHDQIFVWMPAQKILFPGDNIYTAFPNLYSIRGVTPRPVRAWIRSLDAMRALGPEYLVPSHTGPILGAQRIESILRSYRDAIRYVHDSVIRLSNQGLGPDEMAELIKLPPHLRDHPYLQEFYGKLPYCIRGIYDGYLGWFDGNPTNLIRHGPRERGARIVALAGGRDKLLARIDEAIQQEDMPWAAQLADALLAIDKNDARAKQAKAVALWWLGMRESNPNARYYLLTSSLELQGRWQGPARPIITPDTIREMPVEVIVGTFPERLDPVKTADVVMTLTFVLTDVDKSYTLYIRKGIGEVVDRADPHPDLKFVCTEQDLKTFLIGGIHAAKVLGSGRMQITGGFAKLFAFRSYMLRP